MQQLTFSEKTWEAIRETARIKDPRALRRHHKRVANCLAREDITELQQMIEGKRGRAKKLT